MNPRGHIPCENSINSDMVSPKMSKDQQVACTGSSLADSFGFSPASCFLSTFSFVLVADLRASAFTFGLSSIDACDFPFGSLTTIAFFIASIKSLSSFADFDPEELDELLVDAVDDVDDVVWSDHFVDCRDKRRNFLSPMVSGFTTASITAGAPSSDRDSVPVPSGSGSSSEQSSSSSGCFPGPKTLALSLNAKNDEI